GTYMEVLKLIGAAYLVWIGIASFRAPITDPAIPAPAMPDSKARLFRRGYLIGVTNPKPLIFYAAFFPQFINPAEPAAPQLFLLAVTFVVVAVLSDGTYALAAGRLAPYLKARRAQLISNRITGTVLIASGAALALARR
ncbi:LysE family translocator, partial [Parvibaculum sp.]|uniref:LysE family translocator n=1 Tax=Parvibaculum sp. TaxID=2024848 RepID=UPI003C746D47